MPACPHTIVQAPHPHDPSAGPRPYRCPACGKTSDDRADFQIFRQSDWLQLFLETAIAHGLEIFGVDHEHFEPVHTVAEAIEASRACDECTIWLALRGRRFPVAIVWQGPDDTYQQADEIVADYSGPEVLDEIWAETKRQADPILARRNADWSN